VFRQGKKVLTGVAALGALALLAALLASSKELWLFMLPLVYMLARRRGWPRALAATALVAMPAALVTVAIRLSWQPHIETPHAPLTPDTLWLALGRLRTSWGETWPGLLLDGVTPLALAGALTAALAGGSLRPYSRRIGRLAGDPAQERIHERLVELHGGAADWSDAPQGPVSFRVLPQVHGAALGLVEALEARFARALGAVTDSPLFLGADGAEPEGFYPSGNFHSQPIAFALDALAMAFAQVGNLSEKRLHRLLDSRFSGLPDQLALDPGRQSGLILAHKSVLGFVAENRMLAAPASVHPFDGSSGQEDFQALTFVAAEQLERMLDNLEAILAAELVAARQARHLRAVQLPPALEAAVARVAALVDVVDADRSLSEDIERVVALIRSGELLRDLGRA
jgi:histidine ammonia-lyase